MFTLPHTYLVQKIGIAASILAFSSIACSAPDNAQDRRAAMHALPWQVGPTTGSLEGKATIKVPKGARFLDEKSGSQFLELTGNLPSRENILVGDGWWAAFSFDASGYIKDDEKVDADALLKTLKAGDAGANDERRKRGLTEIYTDGWHIPPHYDTATKHLEWALRLRSPDSKEPTINYTVRLLGRTGYESAILVSSPESLDEDVKAFKTVLEGVEFNAGEKYSEFKQGDRVAAFGLTALVAGGAAAVATKTGFWKVLLGFLAASWKLVAGVAVALVAGAGKIFKKKQP